MKLRERLSEITGGAPAAPLLVLFGLNFVDELDQILFSIATPEIRDDLALGDGEIILIAALVSVFVLFAVLPLTYLADRFNRVRLVFFAALGWMSMSVLTGVSGWAGLVFLLVIARMGSGLGRTINDPVHASLFTDYYRPEVLPKVFQVHRQPTPSLGSPPWSSAPVPGPSAGRPCSSYSRPRRCCLSAPRCACRTPDAVRARQRSPTSSTGPMAGPSTSWSTPPPQPPKLTTATAPTTHRNPSPSPSARPGGPCSPSPPCAACTSGRSCSDPGSSPSARSRRCSSRTSTASRPSCEESRRSSPVRARWRA